MPFGDARDRECNPGGVAVRHAGGDLVGVDSRDFFYVFVRAPATRDNPNGGAGRPAEPLLIFLCQRSLVNWRGGAGEAGGPVAQVVDQLGWPNDLEIGADRAERQGRPVQVVDRHAQSARARRPRLRRSPTGRPERAPRRPGRAPALRRVCASAGSGCRRAQSSPHPPPAARGAQSACRWCADCRAGPGESCASRCAPGRRRPGTSGCPSETSRCGSTWRLLRSVFCAVYQKRRRSSSRQAWATVVSTPASTLGPPLHTAGPLVIDAQRVDAPAQVRRHDARDLGQRPHRRLLDAGDRPLRRGAQTDRQGDGFVVVEDERRQRGAGGQLIAAVDAAPRVDRVAELAEPVDVAAQGARRDVEALGELVAGPEAVRLQQGEQSQGARAGVGHGCAACAVCTRIRPESDR